MCRSSRRGHVLGQVVSSPCERSVRGGPRGWITAPAGFFLAGVSGSVLVVRRLGGGQGGQGGAALPRRRLPPHPPARPPQDRRSGNARARRDHPAIGDDLRPGGHVGRRLPAQAHRRRRVHGDGRPRAGSPPRPGQRRPHAPQHPGAAEPPPPAGHRRRRGPGHDRARHPRPASCRCGRARRSRAEPCSGWVTTPAARP